MENSIGFGNCRGSKHSQINLQRFNYLLRINRSEEEKIYLELPPKKNNVTKCQQY